MSSILPKNELENSNFCPSLLGQKYFVRFLEEFKKPKSTFEINRPFGTIQKLCQHDLGLFLDPPIKPPNPFPNIIYGWFSTE